MIKTILFDADGVILKKYKEYFSVRFAREYNAPLNEITAFFKNIFQDCQRGKYDLKKELSKRLKQWNWSQSVDSFLNYWFTTDVQADLEVLNEVRKLRAKGYKCYLATDQEKYRARYLLEHLDFKNIFDSCFFSYDLGYLKSQPEFFVEILKRTNLKPEEIAYFDDDEKNIKIASDLGIQAKFYTGIDDLHRFEKDPL